MKNLFFPFTAKLYHHLKPFFFKKRNPKILKDLVQLNPSENAERLYDSYQIKKFAVTLVILVIGIVSVIFYHINSRMEEKLEGEAELKRNEWGKGAYKITLQAKTQDWSREIPFLVEERKLTEDEINLLLRELQMKLPEIIKNNNQDLQHIVSDLYLPSFVSGYPFQIRWKSSDDEKVSYNGKVERFFAAENEEQVTLTATLTYEDTKVDFTYNVWLLPKVLSEEDKFFQLLEKELQVVEKREGTNYIIKLPANLQGTEIKWKEVKSNENIIFILIIVLGCVMVCRGMDRDLKKCCEKRKMQLLADYAGFVSKLRLYLSAGLTVKKAFTKIANTYEREKDFKRKNYLYEEMKISCYQLENGMMEEKVYQEFGRRCEEMKYRKLAFLLSVHLKQGNNQFLKLLEEEADNALEERRQTAKKLGEEAGTKLLFPMMLMMLVVMALILLPAYFNFGSI